MALMTANPVAWPGARPITLAERDAIPDDGRRYELIDGILVVSPAPTPRHQRAVLHLAMELVAACPPQLEVLVAPLDVDLADDTVMQPDVLVARRDQLTDRGLDGPPLLAVEVVSPSTRRFDLVLKRARYEAAGCESFWAVDPLEPSLTCWDLIDGSYRLVGQASGDQEQRIERPFAVAITPAKLVV
jgi:Uma2 family endonuclease